MAEVRNILRLLVALAIAGTALSLAALPVVQAQSQPGEPLFVEASVDNDRPFLGQQTIYVFTIYQAAGATLGSGQVRYESPAFTGFWNSQKVEQEEYTSTVNSKEYNVIELQTVLFPTVAGTAAIDPGALTLLADATGERHSFKSDTVFVQVRPLPAGAPAGFAGAVGRFNISDQVDTTSTSTGEPVQLTVVVSGEGNIEALPDPDWPDFDGWRVVESPVSTETQVVAGRVTGSRTYGIALIPQRAGDLSISEIGYTHFDPETGEYARAATDPVTVSVAGVDGLPTVPAVPDAGPASGEEETPEMRSINPVPSSLRQKGGNPTGSAAYWAAWAIPPLAVVGAVLWRRRRGALEAARAENLRRSALPDARASLSRAVASGVDPGAASADALLSYLSARLELPVSGMTRGELLRQLQEAGAGTDLLQRVEETLANGEAARYAPSPNVSGGPGNQAERTARLLDELEEAIGA